MPISLTTSCNVTSNGAPFGMSNLYSARLEICVTDCVIMNAWLPAMFSGTGTTCCDETGVTCVDDRITELYVYLN
jgi:hypothetical protein